MSERGGRSGRSEERNAAVRAQLAPLEPGERPLALLVAILLAAALAVANLVAFAAGAEVEGQTPDVATVVVFELLAIAAAVGMWQRRYWAVLGFEVALGVTLAYAGLSLLVASNLVAVLLCVAVLGLGGWLFWKLIRVMGRLQTPQPTG